MKLADVALAALAVLVAAVIVSLLAGGKIVAAFKPKPTLKAPAPPQPTPQPPSTPVSAPSTVTQPENYTTPGVSSQPSSTTPLPPPVTTPPVTTPPVTTPPVTTPPPGAVTAGPYSVAISPASGTSSTQFTATFSSTPQGDLVGIWYGKPNVTIPSTRSAAGLRYVDNAKVVSTGTDSSGRFYVTFTLPVEAFGANVNVVKDAYGQVVAIQPLDPSVAPLLYGQLALAFRFSYQPRGVRGQEQPDAVPAEIADSSYNNGLLLGPEAVYGNGISVTVNPS